MTRFLLIFFPFLCFASINDDLQSGPTVADEITDQWLIKEAVAAHDTQHVLVFKKLFECAKIKTLLEFGLGYSTRYFLDHCNKVISIDIITHGYGPEVMRKFLHIYADYSNWIPIAFFSGYMGWDYGWAPYKHLGSDSVYRATSYQHAYHKHYAKIDNFYLIELEFFISTLFKYHRIDAAFLGHATFLRGDLAKLLFHKVDIIVAHNTEKRMFEDMDDIYGLAWITTPEDYEEIFFPVEGGTTVWVFKKEKYMKLINALQQYAQTL